MSGIPTTTHKWNKNTEADHFENIETVLIFYGWIDSTKFSEILQAFQLNNCLWKHIFSQETNYFLTNIKLIFWKKLAHI